MRRFLAFLCLTLSAFAAADQYDFQAVRVATPPKIDGKVTDEEWGYLPKGTGFFDGQTGQAAEGGTFWLGYDDKYIYFAARAESANPRKLKATEYRSNVSLRSDDAMFLIIDPFSSRSNFNVFGINPRGATDIRIAGGRAAKREWLGEFLAGGRIIETGYEVEARIPWGVMRLPEPGKRSPIFQVVRYNAQTQRDCEWKFLNQDFRIAPLWHDVEMPASGNQRSLKLLPYAYGGFNRKEAIANAGLDLKTSINDQIDLVGTVNPDFRNIENQILSLDFSYFERLAGESRPFFLEGGEYFQTSRDAPLFASQRIRKFDAGFKTFGQLNATTDFALLDTVDFGVENSFAGIAKHRISKATNMTLAATALTGTNASDNVATFEALNHQIGNWTLFGQHMLSRDFVNGNGNRVNFGGVFFKDGWNAVAEYAQISPQFNPRLGFAPERNFKGINLSLDKSSTYKKGTIMETEFAIGHQNYRTYDTNDLYRRAFDATASLTTRDGWDLDLNAHYEKFFNSHDRFVFISLEKPRGDSYRHWQLDAVFGNIAGQPYRSFTGSLSYRPMWNWQVNLVMQSVDHFDHSVQNILSSVYDIGRDMSVSGRLVRDGNDVNAYIAFRKSGEKGAEYFLILGDPNASRFQTALVLKAVIPFEIKF
jgi:hypothetical protein